MERPNFNPSVAVLLQFLPFRGLSLQLFRQRGTTLCARFPELLSRFCSAVHVQDLPKSPLQLCGVEFRLLHCELFPKDKLELQQQDEGFCSRFLLDLLCNLFLRLNLCPVVLKECRGLCKCRKYKVRLL